MTTTFLHGVETVSLTVGPKKIDEVKTAIIGVIGTAPIHHASDAADSLNKAVFIASDREPPTKFGPDLAGYSLLRAIKAAQDQGAGTIFAINVFNPAKAEHRTAVAVATRTITDGVCTLPHQDLISVTVTTSADAACVEGTDYEVDLVTGIITVLEGGNLEGDADCKVAHVRATPAGVVAADVVGAVTDGVRTGMQAFLDCASRFGYGPKTLIAPGFSSTASVRTALAVLAQKTKLRALVLADAPLAATRDDVVEGRGAEGEIDLIVSDPRVVLCYPHLKSFRVATNQTELEPYSGRAAGVIAANDRDRGYWVSPSNKPILGITGTEVALTAAVNDPTCDVNLLNAAGVMTVFAAYGIAPRTWGNRSSAFPGANDILTFIPCLRTQDVIEESIELSTLAHLDGPIGKPLIDAVLADVNEFFRVLIGRGAAMPGSRCEYFDEDNSPAELAAGHLVFTYEYCPPPPAEKLTFKAVVNTNLLAGLGG